MSELLLHAVRRFSVGNNLGGMLGQIDRGGVQPMKPGQRGRMRYDACRVARCLQVDAVQRGRDCREILDRERHRAEDRGPLGPLENRLALGVAEDGVRQQVNAAGLQRRPRLGTEIDDNAARHVGRADYPRQVVGHPLHPNALQVDRDDFTGEPPAADGGQLDVRVAHRLPPGVGVGETQGGATWHGGSRWYPILSRLPSDNLYLVTYMPDPVRSLNRGARPGNDINRVPRPARLAWTTKQPA